MKKQYRKTDFFPYNLFIPPYNKVFFPIAKIILSIPKLFIFSNKKTKVKKEIISNSKVYVFTPKKVERVMIYIHGGGFTFYANPKAYNLCRKYAEKTNCEVYYVDYKLAPKYKYPYQLNECYDVYKYLIGKTNNEMIIGGDSAGGCIAAELIDKIIKENNKVPNKLLLIYPLLDHKMSTKSMKKYNDTPIWNSKLNKKMWKYYVDTKDYNSPLYINDLSKFPKTYIETVEYDCLHDEAIIFKEKLEKEKIDVCLNETKNTIHGYDIKNNNITKESISKRINFIKE